MKFFGIFSVTKPFTIAHWISVLRDPQFTLGLRNSLILGFGVGTVGVAVYLLLGYAIFRHGIMGRSVVSFLVWLPWAIPGILMGLSMVWLFLSFQLISFLYGTIFVLIFTLVIKEMPIGTQLIKAAFSAGVLPSMLLAFSALAGCMATGLTSNRTNYPFAQFTPCCLKFFCIGIQVFHPRLGYNIRRYVVRGYVNPQ